MPPPEVHRGAATHEMRNCRSDGRRPLAVADAPPVVQQRERTTEQDAETGRPAPIPDGEAEQDQADDRDEDSREEVRRHAPATIVENGIDQYEHGQHCEQTPSEHGHRVLPFMDMLDSIKRRV